MRNREVFLDGNSTTPMDPRVARSICAAYRGLPGNPSSTHIFGMRARNLLEKARRNVAGLLGSEKDEIFFVPGVTLALNIILQGIIGKPVGLYRRVATSRIEHRSIIALIWRALSSGFEWVEIEVDRYGAVIPESAGDAAKKGVDFICVSHGNGEVGILNDVEAIISAVDGGGPLVIDASQTAAYLDLSFSTRTDFLILSGHKLYGPRGMAAFYKKRSVELAPILAGAGQERSLIPGTEDVPGALALGVAAQLARRERDSRRLHVNALRDRFFEILKDTIDDVELNGHPVDRVPGNLSLTVPRVPAEFLLRRLPYIGFSAASACTGSSESHVLQALGFSKKRAACTFRIGFNAFNTFDEIERAAHDIVRSVLEFRGRGSHQRLTRAR